MDGGRSRNQSEPSLHTSFASGLQEKFSENAAVPLERPSELSGDKIRGMLASQIDGSKETSEPKDPRQWLKVVGAFEQPRLTYNVNQKHFEMAASTSSLLPASDRKTHLFRQRYQLVHQRLLRSESFQSSAVAAARRPVSLGSSSTSITAQQAYKITPIANLLGRGGSSHMVLGLLSTSPSGLLTVNDLTGSITLDIQYARPSPENGVWFTPGMIVIVDGQYEDEGSKDKSSLDGNTGVGGTIGGIFIAFGMTGPPSEMREITRGSGHDQKDGTHISSAGFGWVDFLGVGSERATGKSMRALEKQVLKRNVAHFPDRGRSHVIILGEVNLDSAKTLQALRKVLSIYAAEQADQIPMAVVVMGNFVGRAVMTGGGSGGSIEYKEFFDALASALSDYPSMLQNTTFVFVPGDNDPWASALSAGAAAAVPRSGVPDVFTSRIRRVFATANSEAENAVGKKSKGEAIWSTNPTRLTLFGPAQEIVFFRDDISSRLRRNAVKFRSPERHPAHSPNKVPESAYGEKDVGADGERQVIELDEAMEIDAGVEGTSLHPTMPRIKAAEKAQVSPDSQTARKLVKTILDQGHLSPFPLAQRPVLWDYAGSLQLYPLPTALVLMDVEAPAFAIGLDGCHVMNPGPLSPTNRKGVAQWIEYDVRIRRGKVKEARY